MGCDGVIDKSRYDLCEFHRAKQYKKFASKRNDTNRTTMSRLRNPQSQKRSLSGKMNGLSMIQRRAPKNFYANDEAKKKKPKRNVDHALNRCKNRNLLINSSAMRKTSVLGKRLSKYTKGGKNQMQIQSAQKRKEMGKMLAGKTLMPHLGADWGSNEKGGLILMGGPTSSSSSVTVSTKQSRNEKRKRSFDAFMAQSNEKENEFEAEIAGGDRSPMRKKMKMKMKGGDGILRAQSENLALEKVRECVAVREEDSWEALTVFVCKFGTCGLRDKVTEKMNSFCEGHAMNVVRSKGKKYFWECTHCGNTTTTLNTKKHRKNCKCGKKEYYVPTSKEGAANPKMKNTEKSFQVG